MRPRRVVGYRALESRSFRRVGGSQTIQVNVRVIAATNRRLREAVRRREFREDLFYRLAVVHVAVPNFFFHMTTAYSILRHNGVPLGKADFIGALPTREA